MARIGEEKFPITDPEEIAEALRRVEGWQDQIAATRARIAGAFREINDIPHVHRWTIIGVWRPQYQPVHPRVAEAVSTVALIRCQVCGLPETVMLKGIWSEDQLRKANWDE